MLNMRIPAEHRQIVRFLVVGIGNTLFGYTVYALLVIAKIDSGLALLAATIIGVMFNFYTTGRLVFANRDAGLLPRFVLAYCITYSFNLVLLKTLESLIARPLISQLICMAPTVVLSYFLLNRFVFRRLSL